MDIGTVFLILGLVYISECLIIAGKDCLVFAPTPFAQAIRTGFAHTGKSLVSLANPVPLFNTPVIVPQEPLSLCPQGVLFFNSLLHNVTHLTPPGQNFLAYPQIHTLETKEDLLLINGRKVICADNPQAEALAGLITRLIDAPATRPAQAAREEILREHLRARLDVGAARARARDLALFARPAAGQATLYALYVFAALPAALLLSADPRVIFGAFAGFVLLHGLTIFCFQDCFPYLYPQDRRKGILAALHMLLLPFKAMASPALLAQDSFRQFHGLAAGYALLRGRARRLFVHAMLAKLMHNTLRGHEDAEARAQLVAHNNLVLESFLAGLEPSLSADALLLKPKPDPSAVAHCPVCLLDYTIEHEYCLYCPGVPLIRRKKV